METHVNIQRRLCDDQCSFTTTPAAFEQVHQTFIQTDNTTAHQGLLNDQCDPPMPLKVLGQAKGRLSTADERMRKCSQALLPRTTTPYGGVTLHSHPFSVAHGVPHTQVRLWVDGEPLRARLDHVVFAEDHGRDNWRTRKVTEIRDGVFYPTRLASPQGMLIPLTPQASFIRYRPTSPRRPAGERVSRQQWLLFELVRPASSESASVRICVQNVLARFGVVLDWSRRWEESGDARWLGHGRRPAVPPRPGAGPRGETAGRRRDGRDG
jgi:hypothetical protein